jgi:hypothetical protein
VKSCDFGILPKAVVVLAAESEVIAGDSNAWVGDIVNKILHVCRSAMAYDLGLVVEAAKSACHSGRNSTDAASIAKESFTSLKVRRATMCAR